MPWLQSQMQDPDGHWLWFPNAFIQTPLCCPSRATILSGRYSRHTHVRTNDDGHLFDESQTIADVAARRRLLHRADREVPEPIPVRTGAVHPARVGPLGRQAQHRCDHDVLELRVRRPGGRPADERLPPPRTRPTCSPTTLSTSCEPRRTTGRSSCTSRRARRTRRGPRRSGTAARSQTCRSRCRRASVERNVSDKPAWVQRLRPVDAVGASRLLADRRHEAETLLGVDDAVERIVGQLERGRIGHTVILFLTDNGYSFGEHRIRGQALRVRGVHPDAVRREGARGARPTTSPVSISNVDLAPTIADLAGVVPGQPWTGGASRPRSSAAVASPAGVFLDWAGDREIPAWQGVRTDDFAYIEDADGTVELYDLTGVDRSRRSATSCGAGRGIPGTGRRCNGSPRCCACSAPAHRADDRLATIVQQPPGPIIRPASAHRRRPTRKQIRRRRAISALGLAAVVFLAWQFWPFGAGGTTSAAQSPSPSSARARERSRRGTVTAS